jgi:hypothetical protein
MDFMDSQLESFLRFPLKERNQAIDALFYDVGALTPDERARLSPLVDLKGTVIVVSPRVANREIRHYKNALRFMMKEGNQVGAIAIAGVGSSVLGTAALARNIADFQGTDVAGIVTGYGVADVMGEALGGWYFYGTVDRIRHAMEKVTESLCSPLPEARLASAATATPGGRGPEEEAFYAPIDSRFLLPGNSDVGTLLDILLARPAKLSLLAGHSKGNLLVSFVLGHMVDELGGDYHPFFDELSVLTLGAVVDLPQEFKQRHQFLGQLDLLGKINSRADVPHEIVPGAGHHLNPGIPYFMRVADVLARVPRPATAEAGAVRRSTIPEWGKWSDPHGEVLTRARAR